MPQSNHPTPPDCGGRFTIQSFLGAGGMGAVYEAYDHQRQSRVAIKVLRRVSGPWIYRFKKEFRSLAGVVHPNLVTLHELLQCEEQWLFTMELVPGVTFSRARRSLDLSPATTEVDSSSEESSADGFFPIRAAPKHVASDSQPLLADVYQVSDALRQLCDGLDYLHRLGIVHGDVKPANAILAPSGRVVILDFGISRDSRSEPDEHGGDSLPVLGTPGYLAPERLKGAPTTPASDMFAVGVTLFEVLASQRVDVEPDPAAVLRRTRGDEPATETAALRREIMENLCLRLMDSDPDARPTAAEVREAVVSEAARAGRQTALQLTRSKEESPFVARAAELESIRNALLDSRAEAPHVVIVSGESGIGKTELMRRIIDAELPSSCLVLEGKCYEWEQVPYRALDRLVDSLSSKLLGVDADALQALSWADVLALSRMFPVLRRVPEINRLCEKDLRPDERDPREQRRAAAATLGQMLALVAEGRKLVLYIDDLHWGDEESGAVLREVLLHARGLDMRMVGCHRYPVRGSRLLSRLIETEPPIGHFEVHVGGLPPADSEDLARALIGPDAHPSHVARVAAEAEGNPFLIRELVEFGAGENLDEVGLRSSVSRHVELLSEQARRVLEVVVVAGRRLDTLLARSATGIGQTFEAAVILLRSQHLVKASDARGEQIEPYHDRIREVIADGLSPDTLAARHADLVRALEERGDPDPALIGFHLEGAGELQRAAEFILRAAANAEASLAPLNAAGHFAKVVELTSENDPEQLVALHGQARSLSAAGRAASAASVYMQLVDRADLDDVLELRRNAAEAWTYAGEHAKAREALRGVLEAAGVREPKTLLGVLFEIARNRAWLWRRKNCYHPRREADIAPERLLRVDAYETATELSSSVDLLRTYSMHLAGVRESLEVGEPRRVARALVEDVIIGGIGGESANRKGLELLRIAGKAIEDGDFPLERALLRSATGVRASLNGRYKEVVEILGELAHAPDLEPKGQRLHMVRSVLGYSRWWLGQWRTMADEYQAWISDAVERGDQHSACGFRLEQMGQWAAVLEDEPERAAEQVVQSLASPVAQTVSFEHLAAKQTRSWVALYMGRADEAERVLQVRGAQKAYLRVQRSRIEIAVLHAYAALARGPAGHRRARSWMRRIEREGPSWPQPIVRIIGASIAAQQGRIDESVAALEVAISLCEQQGFAMFSAAASWRLGELQAGADGEARRAAAEDLIAEQGASRPDRIVRTLAPGFRDSL